MGAARLVLTMSLGVLLAAACSEDKVPTISIDSNEIEQACDRLAEGDATDEVDRLSQRVSRSLVFGRALAEARTDVGDYTLSVRDKHRIIDSVADELRERCPGEQLDDTVAFVRHVIDDGGDL